MYRNRMYIYRKHYGLIYQTLYSVDYILTSLMVLFKSKNSRFKRFKATLFGTVKGLFFNPKVKYPTIK